MTIETPPEKCVLAPAGASRDARGATSDAGKRSRPGCTRRDLLRLGAASFFAPNPACAAAGATRDLAHRLREAARTGAAVRLPPGVTTIRGLELPDGAILIGAPGGSTLRLIGAGPLLSANFAKKISLESLVFDGAGAYVPKEKGLLDLTDIFHISIHGCVFRNSAARGVNLLRCGGRFAQNTIEYVKDAGYCSLDGLGVDFEANHVRACDDNGVMVWTTSAGRYEGSRLRGNLIEDIRNISGGVGAYGNGVSIWGSGDILVERNRIRRCAYTAVRNNAGHDVAVVGNDCKTFGEKAMYAEFGAKRSIFRDNRIDDAGAGIAVTNADHGTEGGMVTGNIVTGLKASHPDAEFGPAMGWLIGVAGEKSCEIAGNTVVGPGWIGVGLGGWREDVRAVGNRLEGLDYGVVFATGEGAGEALIARNRIKGARKAAIAATAGWTFLPGDVSKPGEAGKFPRLVVRDNDVS